MFAPTKSTLNVCSNWDCVESTRSRPLGWRFLRPLTPPTSLVASWICRMLLGGASHRGSWWPSPPAADCGSLHRADVLHQRPAIALGQVLPRRHLPSPGGDVRRHPHPQESGGARRTAPRARRTPPRAALPPGAPATPRTSTTSGPRPRPTRSRAGPSTPTRRSSGIWRAIVASPTGKRTSAPKWPSARGSAARRRAPVWSRPSKTDWPRQAASTAPTSAPPSRKATSPGSDPADARQPSHQTEYLYIKASELAATCRFPPNERF
jgi:hypothetical protein